MKITASRPRALVAAAIVAALVSVVAADVWGAYATFMLFEGAQYLEPDEKKAWRVEGAAAAQRAVELGYFQDKLGLNGAIYLEQAGYKDLAIAQLERAYAVAPNEET